MDLFGIGSIANAGVNLINGVWSNIQNKQIADQNFALERENLDYQKQLQQTIFNREDTAMQRAMADYEAAGINPLYAIGSPAQSGAVVSTSAPQNKFQFDGSYFQDLIKGIAEINLIGQQRNTLKAQEKSAEAAAALTDAKKDELNYNLDYYREAGQPTNMTGTPKAILEGFTMLQSVLKKENVQSVMTPTTGFIWQDVDEFSNLVKENAKNFKPDEYTADTSRVPAPLKGAVELIQKYDMYNWNKSHSSNPVYDYSVYRERYYNENGKYPEIIFRWKN